MTFVESIKTCFSKYATFSGRATRSEFWWFWVFTLIASFIPLLNLAVIIPAIAVGVRRLHDIGKSGWYMLLALIPVVDLVLLYFFAIEGQGDNQYGSKQA